MAKSKKTKIHKKTDGQLLQMNKSFNNLKMKQKDKITAWVYEEYKKYVTENEKVPDSEADEHIIDEVLDKINEAQIWIPSGEIVSYYYRKKWMCKYHIVFTPKYRRKIIYNQYKESIRDILKQLCEYKGVEILEGHLMPDHVHMLVSIPPKLSVSQFMGYLKGKSALMIFDKHANLKYKFGNRHFWAEGYYVSTVGLNEATIRKYIQEQESHDIAMDKLSVKEYEDPFKG